MLLQPASLLLVLIPFVAQADDNWPQWRGPLLNGSTTTAKNLPVHWTETENVIWRTKLPSWSAATPIVWGDTIFVTSAEAGFQSTETVKGVLDDPVRGGPPSPQEKILLFAVKLRWFPALGNGTDLASNIRHFTLPAIALAISSLAIVARVTRASIREEGDREHVQTAVSRGIPARKVIQRHILRNAAIPITTITGITIASLIAVAAVVEVAFSLNGLGAYLVQAAQSKDLAVVQGISLVLVTAFVVVNLLDPDRAGGGRGAHPGPGAARALLAVGAIPRGGPGARRPGGGAAVAGRGGSDPAGGGGPAARHRTDGHRLRGHHRDRDRNGYLRHLHSPVRSEPAEPDAGLGFPWRRPSARIRLPGA